MKYLSLPFFFLVSGCYFFRSEELIHDVTYADIDSIVVNVELLRLDSVNFKSDLIREYSISVSSNTLHTYQSPINKILYEAWMISSVSHKVRSARYKLSREMWKEIQQSGDLDAVIGGELTIYFITNEYAIFQMGKFKVKHGIQAPYRRSVFSPTEWFAYLYKQWCEDVASSYDGRHMWWFLYASDVDHVHFAFDKQVVDLCNAVIAGRNMELRQGGDTSLVPLIEYWY
jgi:hypothetical protein